MELGIRFCMVVIQNQEEEAYDKGRNRTEWEAVKGFSFRQHSGCGLITYIHVFVL